MDIRLAVISYPALSKKDFDWIQHVRSEHDMHYKLIKPHFTFVFPSYTDRVAFMKHVVQSTQDSGKFAFTIRCAITVAGCSPSAISYVFLIPDEGFSDVVRLHDKLYTGVLSPELRLDIPFYPHIGIGSSTDVLACKRLADDLNGKDFTIKGFIDKLDIVEIVATDTVSTEAPEIANVIQAVKTIEQILLR